MDRTLLGLPYEGAWRAGAQMSGVPTTPPDTTGRAPGYIPAGYQMNNGALSLQQGQFPGSTTGMPNIDTSNIDRLFGAVRNSPEFSDLMTRFGLSGTPASTAPGAIPAGFQRDASGALSPQMPQMDGRARLRNAMMGGAPTGGLGRLGAMQSSGGWRGGRMGYGG